MPSTYEKIATVVGTGGSQILTFSSIPSTYTDLVIHGAGNFQNGDDLVYMVFNGDGGNQTAPFWYNDPFTNGVQYNANPPYAWRQNIFNNVKLEFPNYRSSLVKTWTGFTGGRVDVATKGRLIFGSGIWNSTAAITSIGITMYAGTSQWTTASSFTLYGITRA